MVLSLAPRQWGEVQGSQVFSIILNYSDGRQAMSKARTATVKLPEGWSVEMLGLISGVKFTRRGFPGTTLLWCDGEWTMGFGAKSMPARGVPTARTMSEARSYGTAWLAEHAER